MRIFITILLCIASVFGMAQGATRPQSWIGTTLNEVLARGVLATDTGFVNARYTDTTQANLGYIKTRRFAMISTSSDNQYWMRNNTATGWIKVITEYNINLEIDTTFYTTRAWHYKGLDSIRSIIDSGRYILNRYNTRQIANSYYDSSILKNLRIASEDSALRHDMVSGVGTTWGMYEGTLLTVRDIDTANFANDWWPFTLNANALVERITRLNGFTTLYRNNFVSSQVYEFDPSGGGINPLGGNVGTAITGRMDFIPRSGTAGHTVLTGGATEYAGVPVVLGLIGTGDKETTTASVRLTGYWAGVTSFTYPAAGDTIDNWIGFNSASKEFGHYGTMTHVMMPSPEIAGITDVAWGIYAPDKLNVGKHLFGGQVGFGREEFGTHGAPTFKSSAQIQINSHSRGFITSRMTAAQRIAIAADTALFVWDSDSSRFFGYRNNAWRGIAWTSDVGTNYGRFAVSGEDNTAGQDRDFSQLNYRFSIYRAGDLNNPSFSINPLTGAYFIGDNNDAYIQLDSSVHTITMQAKSSNYITFDGDNMYYGLTMNGGFPYFSVDIPNQLYRLGDISSFQADNNSYIEVDDVNGEFSFFRSSERVRLNDNGILIPNGIMPTSGNVGDSVVKRNSTTGQFYLGEVSGSGGYFSPNQTSSGITIHNANYNIFNVDNLYSTSYTAGTNNNYSNIIMDSTQFQLSTYKSSGAFNSIQSESSTQRFLFRSYNTVESSIEIKPDSISLYNTNGNFNVNAFRSTVDTNEYKPVVWGVNNKSLRRFNSWGELGLGGGGTPGGSNKQVQYNNSGAFGGTTGMEYGNSNELVKITNQSAADTTLKIVGSASQTGNLLNIRDNSGNALLNVRSNGANDIQLTWQPWYSLFDEFTYPTYNGFYAGSNGTGASNAILTNTNIIRGWFSGVNLNVGTTSAGYAYFLNNSSAGGGNQGVYMDSTLRYNCGAKIRLEDLSDGTDTYKVVVGFINSGTVSGGQISNGMYFRYTHADSSGKFIIGAAITNPGLSKTEVQTSVTVAADTDYELEVSTYKNVAYYWINKTLVGTITTNLPVEFATVLSVAGSIVKTAGTNERKMYADWAAWGVRKN